jgi:hypothetical protein
MSKSYLKADREYEHRYCGGDIVAIRKRGGVKMLDPHRNAQIEEFLRNKAVDDPRVLAIREDEMIGNGTDSLACKIEDWQIVQELDKEDIVKPVFARMYYRKMQRIHKSILHD